MGKLILGRDMRAADYKCKDCGHVIERVFDGTTIPPVVHASHTANDGPGQYRCLNTEFHRYYGKVAVGAGTSGGTPARQ